MNEISPQDKILATDLLLRLVGEEVLTPLEKRDILHEITQMLTGFNIADLVNATNNRRRLLLKRINENETYVGLPGEIAMDMEAKTLRIFNGENEEGILLGSGGGTIDIEALLANIDYVVASATGLTGTNYTNGWYRKYKSGWIEQGFRTSAGGDNITVTLPFPMADSNYSYSAGFDMNGATGINNAAILFRNNTATNVTLAHIWTSAISTAVRARVFISGAGAQ